MPIYFNGNPNPTSVYCNSVSLDTVYAAYSGSSTYYAVWERSHAGPSTINLQRVTFSNGSSLYFRNMQYVIGFYSPSRNIRGAVYEGDVTFETTFPAGRQIGPNLDPNENYRWFPDETDLTFSFTGDLPSDYKFFSAETTNPNSSIAFDVYQDSTPVAMNLNTSLDYFLHTDGSTVSARFTTQATGEYWPVRTRSNGWIYQNTGSLYIFR